MKIMGKNKKKLMDAVVNEINACNICDLCKGIKNHVPGEGNLNAGLFFVGEAPGKNEDAVGRPFVGSAGKLLNKLLRETGMTRSDVYIGNVVKCRPPGNRKPRRNEVDACSAHLEKQLMLVKPKIIAPMGNSAVEYIFRRFSLCTEVIGVIHGEIFKIEAPWGQITVIPLYHPAAAIYNRKLMGMLETDFASLKVFLS